MKIEGIPNHVSTDHQHNVVVKVDYDTQEFIAETVKVLLIGSAGLLFLATILKKV